MTYYEIVITIFEDDTELITERISNLFKQITKGIKFWLCG